MNLLTKILLGAGLGGAAIYGASKLVEEYWDFDDDGDHAPRRNMRNDDYSDLCDLFTTPNESTTIPDARSYGRCHANRKWLGDLQAPFPSGRYQRLFPHVHGWGVHPPAMKVPNALPAFRCACSLWQG